MKKETSEIFVKWRDDLARFDFPRTTEAIDEGRRTMEAARRICNRS